MAKFTIFHPKQELNFTDFVLATNYKILHQIDEFCSLILQQMFVIHDFSSCVWLKNFDFYRLTNFEIFFMRPFDEFFDIFLVADWWILQYFFCNWIEKNSDFFKHLRDKFWDFFSLVLAILCPVVFMISGGSNGKVTGVVIPLFPERRKFLIF